jgi:hypothetical protein
MHNNRNLCDIEGHKISILTSRLAYNLWTSNELLTRRICDDNAPDRSHQTDRLPFEHTAEYWDKINKLKSND